MAATNQQIADAARDSLARILATDASELSEESRKVRQLEIDKLEGVITKFEAKEGRSGARRIFRPVTRVNL